MFDFRKQDEIIDGIEKLRAIANEVQVILNDHKFSIKGLDRDAIINRLENIMKLDPARESDEQQNHAEVKQE